MAPQTREVFVVRKSTLGFSLCLAGLLTAGSVVPAQARSVIRACANPAGQLRLIGATESCKSQETLVTWNAAGSEGVTGGADRGPAPGDGPAPLGAAPFVLTTDNIGTGFPGYMVWANVGLEFNSGNPAMGTAPSPSGAGCAIVYTVSGRVGTFFVDGRPVTFPIFAFGQNDRIVRIPVGLTGVVGHDLTPPLLPTETVNITLQCNTPGFTPPTTGPQPIPVKVVSWSLTGIGISKPFQE